MRNGIKTVGRLLPFAWFVALTALLLFPLVRHPCTQIPDLGDTLHNIHTYRSNYNNLLSGRFWSFDGGIYYPERRTLLFAELQIPNTIFYKLAELLCGNAILAYNICLFLSFPLTAAGAYLIVLEFGVPLSLATFVGTATTFACYRFVHLSHLQLLSGYWSLFCGYFAVRYARKGGWGAVLASSTLAWLQLSSPGYNAFCLLVLLAAFGLAALASFWNPDQRHRRAIFLLGGFGLAALLVLPFWRAYFTMKAAGFSRDIGEHLLYGLDLTYLFFSIPADTLYGSVSQRFAAFRPDYTISPVFAGFVSLAAMAVLARFAWGARRNMQTRDLQGKMARAFVFSGGLLVLLGFGPTIKILGKSAALNPTYILFAFLTPLSSLRYLPALFWWGVTFLFVGLASVAAMRLRAAWTKRATFLCLIATAAFVGENYVPIAATSFPYGTKASLPEAYRVLRREAPGAVAVFPYPKAIDGADKGFAMGLIDMYFETWHHHPLLWGVTGFFPDQVVDTLSKLKDMPDLGGLAYLQRRSVRYILVHPEEDRVAQWNKYEFLLDKLYAGQNYRLYRVGDDFLRRMDRLPTSMHPQGLRGRVEVLNFPGTVRASTSFWITLRVTNSGEAIWLGNTQYADNPGRGQVRAAVRQWTALNGAVVHDGRSGDILHARADLDQDVWPGESKIISLEAQTPAMPGKYKVEIAVVSELVEWLPAPADQTLAISIEP